MEIPKLVGRYYKPVDIFGWSMTALGLFLMCKFGGIGRVIPILNPIFGSEINWWLLLITFYISIGYMIRVSLGRVYTIIYYDTITQNIYEIKINYEDEIHRVAANDEDELKTYMEVHYPNITYTILSSYEVESFVKKEHYQ